MKKFIILTLFTNMFNDFINTSIIKNAINKKIINIKIINIRKYSKLKHQQIDDYQYGGGGGMVLMAPCIVDAINIYKTKNSLIILLTPQGKKYNQKIAKKLASNQKTLILICGHYEGFDERIRKYVNLELSIGDYILTGGELPSMIIIDSVARLYKGVIKYNSHINESFNNNLLDYPIFTKPFTFNGEDVPKILLSGNHKKILEWRNFQALKKTYLKRKDLLKNTKLTIQQQQWLKIIQKKR